MAVAPVKGDMTVGTAATSSLAVSATANNTLVVFIACSGATVEPKIKDDQDGETGWVIRATNAKANESKGAVWCAIKAKAKGTETKVEASVTGGTIQGLAYAELSGTAGEVDTITAYNNISAAVAKEHTTGEYSTTDAGGAMLIGYSQCGAATLGTIEAWTGGPPTLELPGAGKTSRCGIGYKAPGSAVTNKTFTCKHSTARAEVGMLAVSFKASEEAPKTTQAHTNALQAVQRSAVV